MNSEAEYLIKKLNLTEHPEGGYFKEIYRAKGIIAKSSLPSRYDGERNISTSIYFLLEGENISKFHRLKSDELWHHYSGSTIIIHIIDEAGDYSQIRLGKDLEKNEIFQVVIPAGVWFAANIDENNSYSLIGCTVAPGFDFKDFELGNRDKLMNIYPQHKSTIEELT